MANRQLSDVNRDGALSLDEFCTAMHLVVLRRNDIELPDTLPPVLQPYTPLVTSGNQHLFFAAVVISCSIHSISNSHFPSEPASVSCVGRATL